MRDTGEAHSLTRRKDIPAEMRQKTGKIKTIIGIGGKPSRTEIYKIKLESKWKNGEMEVGMLETLPMKGISILLGNDVGGKTTDAEPKKMSKYLAEEKQHTWKNIENKTTAIVTRQNQNRLNGGNTTTNQNIPRSKNKNEDCGRGKYNPTKHPDQNLPRKELMNDQQKDPEIIPLYSLIERKRDKNESGQYYIKAGLLMRKWRTNRRAKKNIETKYYR